MDLKGSLGWQSTKLEFKKMERATRETAKYKEALVPIFFAAVNLTARTAYKATAELGDHPPDQRSYHPRSSLFSLMTNK